MKKEKVCESDKVRILSYFTISFLLVGISFSIIYFDTAKMIVDWQLTLAPGTYLFHLWQKPPIPTQFNIYLFNITNAETFLSGQDGKIMYHEIGPYAFKETFENKNITFHGNDTVSYSMQRSYKFEREKSSGDLNTDVITTTNIILLGGSTIAFKLSPIAALGFAAVAKSTHSKPILNMTVYEYLFGYEDIISTMGSKILPSLMAFEKFGLFDQFMKAEYNHTVTTTLKELFEETSSILDSEKNKSKEQETFYNEMNNDLDVEYEDDSVNNDSNHLKEYKKPQVEEQKPKSSQITKARDFSISLWNGSPFLPNWKNPSENKNHTSCNLISGSFDGLLYSKKILKTDKLKIFRKAFCRNLVIYYSHSEELFKGVEVYWFTPSENSIHDDLENPDTSCYCDKLEKCYKKGIGNVSPCYHGYPLSVSQPHFYDSDKSLKEQFVGLNPQKEKHQTKIAIQPRLGITLNFQMRTQLNLMTGTTKFNSDIDKFDNLAIPLGWVENIVDDLPISLKIYITSALNILPVVMKILALSIVCTGIWLLLTSFKLLKIKLENCNHDEKKNVDLKETSKFLEVQSID